MTRRSRETFPCPQCGYDVPEGALACPDCGSDEETGWSEMAYVGGLDLPDPDGDDELEQQPAGTILPRAVIAVVAVVVAVVFLLLNL